MKVTIGERLGRVTRDRDTAYIRQPRPVSESDGVPYELHAEMARPNVRLAECPSSTLPWAHPERRPADYPGHVQGPGPRRKRGEMVYLHKTAPVLVIEGGPTLSAEEHAAGRRR